MTSIVLFLQAQRDAASHLMYVAHFYCLQSLNEKFLGINLGYFPQNNGCSSNNWSTKMTKINKIAFH